MLIEMLVVLDADLIDLKRVVRGGDDVVRITGSEF